MQAQRLCFLFVWVLEVLPSLPQGQLFIAARSVNSQGKRATEEARLMFMKPSSSGWRRVSRTERGNSVISSIKRMPLWARVISPGRILFPPPVMEIFEAV